MYLFRISYQQFSFLALQMSTAGEAAINRITDTAAMVDIVMGADTVDTNCTMGAVTEVDMEVTNPVTVAGMEVTEVTDVLNLEVMEGTKPVMADTEVTDTVMADTGDTDTTRVSSPLNFNRYL